MVFAIACFVTTAPVQDGNKGRSHVGPSDSQRAGNCALKKAKWSHRTWTGQFARQLNSLRRQLGDLEAPMAAMSFLLVGKCQIATGGLEETRSSISLALADASSTSLHLHQEPQRIAALGLIGQSTTHGSRLP